MAFDASALSKALEPPSIVVDRPWWERVLLAPLRPLAWVGVLDDSFFERKTHTGRLLSHAEFAPYADRWAQAYNGDLDDEESRQLVEDYLEAIGIPSRVVLQLPHVLVQEALADFLACQRRSIQRDPTPTKTTDETGGTDSTPGDGTPSGTTMTTKGTASPNP